MDPNATVQRLLEAIDDHDLEAAREAADDLSNWLARGGFAPDWLRVVKEFVGRV